MNIFTKSPFIKQLCFSEEKSLKKLRDDLTSPDMFLYWPGLYKAKTPAEVQII